MQVAEQLLGVRTKLSSDDLQDCNGIVEGNDKPTRYWLTKVDEIEYT